MTNKDKEQLERIKEQYQYDHNPFEYDDIYWLIDKLEKADTIIRRIVRYGTCLEDCGCMICLAQDWQQEKSDD